MQELPEDLKPIIQQIEAGDPIKKLARKCREPHKRKKLNLALAFLAVSNPQLYDQTIGKPKTENTILADSCVAVPRLADIHRSLARVHHTRFAIGFGMEISDQDLFDQAAEKGYRAIITADGRDKTPEDLCAYAKSRYQQNLDTMYPSNLPGIIVVSHEKEAKGIEKAQSIALAYLSNYVPSGILDLRYG